MYDVSDLDAVAAAADLSGRAGARSFEIGYLHDNVPVEEAGWYAHAQYRGARITAENHRSPEEAATALAMRLLKGAKCRCGRLVALSQAGAVALPNAEYADGSTWTVEDARAAGQCLWTRDGARWQPSCDAPPLRGRRGQGWY